MQNNLPISTAVLLVRGEAGKEEIFLGEKASSLKAIQRRIAGKLLPYGGDFEPDKDASIAHGATRELGEESDYRAKAEDLVLVARIQINDENGPRLVLYIYILRTWTGEAGISNEILSPAWYPTRPLPENVLELDKIILPRIFKGEKLVGSATYDANMHIVNYRLDAVDSL